MSPLEKEMFRVLAPPRFASFAVFADDGTQLEHACPELGFKLFGWKTYQAEPMRSCLFWAADAIVLDNES